MTMHQTRRFCRDCEKKTLHAKYQFSDGMGCLLTLLTGGLFLLLWIPLWLINAAGPARCQVCGRRN